MIQNKLVIGVTGISGSGTSTVSKILDEVGGVVLSADKMVHDIMQKEGEAYYEIVKLFGDEILDEDDNINRKKLGSFVFGDDNKEKLFLLESIIHPKVTKIILRGIDYIFSFNFNVFAVIDAPLLIESGLNKHCNRTWVVTSSYENRLKRIVKRDNISEDVARKRLSSRKGDNFLSQHADTIIENNKDLASLRKNIFEKLAMIK